MGALLALQKDVMAQAAKVTFEHDFALASREMPIVKKDAKKDMGEKGVIPYASYEKLDAVVRKIEDKYGFTRRFVSRPIAGGIVQICVLSHSAGHSIESEMQLPPDPGPGRNALQAMGSSRSYGRRYLTLDIWNIVTVGADDDGESIGLLSEKQILAIEDLMFQAGMKPAGRDTPEAAASRRRFMEFAGAGKVSDIKADRYDELVRKLRLKAAQK
jgi:hypothetical protein